ncbi:MAG: N-acetylmuramoyl-L-alanine amidase [Rhizobiales bacterium]|nr:N-acetylmuramoyl-L-alanine amidase [Hyphomicrobiales bacterium]
MRPINEIILHCTATPEGRPVTVAEIDAWHRARGWSGVGYHRVIGLNGERWAGRAIEAIGAHCEGHNTGTLGVVYCGGVAKDGRTPKDTRNAAQRSALLVELTELRDRFNIRKISGHNEYAAKACPSFDASKEYDYLFEGRSKGFQPIIDKVLKRGDEGSDVVAWREKLMTWRAISGGRGSLQSGMLFDHAVEMETLAFQRSRGIVVDGKVGPQTMMEMELALTGRPPFKAVA